MIKHVCNHCGTELRGSICAIRITRERHDGKGWVYVEQNITGEPVELCDECENRFKAWIGELKPSEEFDGLFQEDEL